MRNHVNPMEITSYREKGFVVIPDFLSSAEIENWRESVEEAVALRADRKVPNLDWKAGDSFYDKVFTQRLNLWMDHPGVRKLMLSEALGKLAADLAGVDGIRIWHDQALIKEPWANPTAFHLDVPYWSFSSRDAISVWVALDDVDLRNGCLFFLPGTHQLARYENVNIGENMNDIFKVYPEFRNIEPVAAPMKAGSCSFHNGLTVHGAHANMTPRRRRAMTCGYMPDGCTFNGHDNILPPEYQKTLKVGDVLDNGEQNPLIYKRPNSP